MALICKKSDDSSRELRQGIPPRLGETTTSALQVSAITVNTHRCCFPVREITVKNHRPESASPRTQPLGEQESKLGPPLQRLSYVRSLRKAKGPEGLPRKRHRVHRLHPEEVMFDKQYAKLGSTLHCLSYVRSSRDGEGPKGLQGPSALKAWLVSAWLVLAWLGLAWLLRS